MKALTVLNHIMRDVQPVPYDYGNHTAIIHADIFFFTETKTHFFINANLIDGRKIDGRVFKKSHRFSGLVTEKNGEQKKYRSLKKH
jgi:hypothetical protein